MVKVIKQPRFSEYEEQADILFQPHVAPTFAGWRIRWARSIWIANAAYALTPDRFHQMMIAMTDREDTQQERTANNKLLTQLVRDKVLRSRVQRKKRYYELNLQTSE